MQELEHRVQTLESNHGTMTHEMRRMNEMLEKIEQGIEKYSDIHLDLRLLRQEFISHIQREEDTIKRQNARIEAIENNISRLAWLVVTAVISALMMLILKGNS